MPRDPFTDADRIALTTKHGQRIELTQTGGIVVDDGQGTTLTLDSRGVTVRSPGRLEIQASRVDVNAGFVEVNAGMSRFTGLVQCDTLVTNQVIAASYTPGAGNIW